MIHKECEARSFSSLNSITGEQRERKPVVTTQHSILCFTVPPPFKPNEKAAPGVVDNNIP